MAKKEDNLKPFTSNQSREEAVKNGKKGGIASGEARRNKRDLRLALEMLLEKDMKSKSGEVMSGTEAITAKLFEQALKGNVKAFETIRSTVGQDPVQKIMVSEVEQSVIDEVEAMVRGGTVTAKPKVDLSGKILQINKESGEIVNTYPTAAKAARANGLDPSNLSKALKSGKVVGGYKWQKRSD